MLRLYNAVMFKWFKNRRRAKIAAQPWPDDWSLFLNRNVRLTWELTEQESKALHSRVKIFVAEKTWEGCEGLQVTDEMRVTIAAQAGLMLLGVDDFYFDNVRSILIFPSAFRRKVSDGLVAGEANHAGEAWQGGPIILSWPDTLRGGRNEDDGHNLVVHEFAHALDGLDGEMGGEVVFDDAESSRQWSETVENEFLALSEARDLGRRTLLDHYGATNHAEFFAVACEAFFEMPHEMQQRHQELFRLMKRYFNVDPTRWQKPRRY